MKKKKINDTSCKKKVVFLTPTLAGGGAEKVFLTLASCFQEYAQSQFDVLLVALSGQGVLRSHVSDCVNFTDLHSRRARYSLWRLWSFCQREQPDVVVASMQASVVFAIVSFFLTKKPKYVVRLENPYTFDVRKMNVINRHLYRYALKKCDAIITLSDGMTTDLLQSVSIRKEKVHKIYNPIDIQKVKTDARLATDSPMVSPAIVACGRLTEQKGFSYLIKALPLIHAKIPGVHLYILGDGEERESLGALATEQGIDVYVHLLGFVPNPYSFMAKADVFALSSIWEGFGNVLVEAMASSVPVVSTDCPTGPAEILDGGRYGLLVEKCNPEALANAVIEMLASAERRQQYRQRALQRAEDFETVQIVKEYQTLFMQLI